MNTRKYFINYLKNNGIDTKEVMIKKVGCYYNLYHDILTGKGLNTFDFVKISTIENAIKGDTSKLDNDINRIKSKLDIAHKIKKDIEKINDYNGLKIKVGL